MAMREKKGSVWKEKKRGTSPTNSHSIPPTTTGHPLHKTTPKPSTSSTPQPQKLHPNNPRPTLIARYEQTASKLQKKPIPSSSSSSVAPKPTPKPTPKPINDRRSSLSSPKSLKIAASPSKPVTRPFSGGRPSGKQKMAKRSTTMGSSSATEDNHEPDFSSDGPVSCNSPPDLMDNVSIIESEHEEAEGMMCYEIDEELDQIESRGMSPTQIPTLEKCASSSSLASSSLAGVEIGSRISIEDDADADVREGGGSGSGRDEIKECDVEKVIDELESSKVEDAKMEAVKEEGVKNATVKRQSGGKSKKDSPAYNDVIEETASKLLEKRKNKVKALVGAFETVISLQEPEQAVQEPELPKHEEKKIEQEHIYESKIKQEEEDNKDLKVEEEEEEEEEKVQEPNPEPEQEQKQEQHHENEEIKELKLEQELPPHQDP